MSEDAVRMEPPYKGIPGTHTIEVIIVPPDAPDYFVTPPYGGDPIPNGLPLKGYLRQVRDGKLKIVSPFTGERVTIDWPAERVAGLDPETTLVYFQFQFMPAEGRAALSQHQSS
jgi:hypothetical protein